MQLPRPGSGHCGACAEAPLPRHDAHLVGLPYARRARACVRGQKRAIAWAAAGLIQDGESILINGGTITCGLVEFLAAKSPDIPTNSLPIVTQLMRKPHHRLTLPGGTRYREQDIIVSPYENDAVERFWGKKLFTGCCGLNRLGLMEGDPLVVQARLKLLRRSEELILLADSSKLRQRAAMIVADLNRISTLITDSVATDEELAPLRDAGVRVIRVDGDEADNAEPVTSAVGS